MTSNRIFATLFYPNTLAGAVLLFTPVSLAVLPSLLRPGPALRILRLLLLLLAGGCLVWSGSKAGWLLAVGVLVLALLRVRISWKLRVAVAGVLLFAGGTGFLVKYADYLERGATSAAARLDYWEAALSIATHNPLAGSGPGTFGRSYALIKRPESEMSQMTHNDYLQQASDSGFPGLLFFTGFLAATLAWTGRRCWIANGFSGFAIWLGLLAIALQSLVEFGFYIPAISWPSMALLGWLVGVSSNGLDKAEAANLS
jgi:O-antigen ligase